MGRLEKKVAIITGAASGIGLAICKAFAKEGAIVVMADINMEKCAGEAEELQKKGYPVEVYKCDVGDADSVASLIENTVTAFQKIDVLVNNAAIAKSYDITRMKEDEFDELVNINLKSVFRGIKMSLPYMLRQNSGSIISISSVQAHRSWDDWTVYAGIKGAIMAMSSQLAGQYGRFNVRFNTISPGAIMTPLNQERIKNEGEEFLKKSETQAAMNRMGTSQEVAMTAVFLASDESTFITGEDLKVDGGLCTLPRYI
ncbi:SDR family NAD(P)-dependent oxidoreductase [Zobellia galactanivorans]|uniref:3-Oxoacyl-[acyl-carrier-protein] reductase n=1 Tax=Zobellia galactanivorans (strain DSM 12802 / CCUG 47099 / CIP 106680 / NCIMB 13871 / Dsij) TaxID=63186 RepID=G0L2P2_ZOBGA|nr:SDR family oxidoreductase [Zobellia galactanivorans]MBU3027934.1 SDR family oxidoreductase [Zobellia galactanivorans]CAZ95105.1 3-Oxoacyl-[acyl-carrier-protein] reductase [Zobellia galactanivorans]